MLFSLWSADKTPVIGIEIEIISSDIELCFDNSKQKVMLEVFDLQGIVHDHRFMLQGQTVNKRSVCWYPSSPMQSKQRRKFPEKWEYKNRFHLHDVRITHPCHGEYLWCIHHTLPTWHQLISNCFLTWKKLWKWYKDTDDMITETTKQLKEIYKN